MSEPISKQLQVLECLMEEFYPFCWIELSRVKAKKELPEVVTDDMPTLDYTISRSRRIVEVHLLDHLADAVFVGHNDNNVNNCFRKALAIV